MPNRHASDANDSLLRMSDTAQTYALDYTDGEYFDIDLNMYEARMKPLHPC